MTLGLEELFRRNQEVAGRLPLLREAVQQGRMTPFAASRELLARPDRRIIAQIDFRDHHLRMSL